MKKYYSSFDGRLLSIVLISVGITCIFLMILFSQWIKWIIPIDAALIIYTIYVLYSVKYVFRYDYLEIEMLRRKNKLPYKDIRKVEKLEIGGRPCLGFSRKRIKLIFKNGDYLYISPKNREEVYTELLSHMKKR